MKRKDVWTPYKIWDETEWYEALKRNGMKKCAICERIFYSNEERFPVGNPVVHHLIPKQKHGGKKSEGEGILICSKCHKQVHKLFDNSRYHTLEKIKSCDEIKKFVKWIRKE
jgi:5-methylcytosine-specific restriction endonuclease McrA